MMEDSPRMEQGLCAICLHARRITSDRGSVFVMCDRARTNPAFPRYPRLPVLGCSGFDRIINSMPHIAPARLKPGIDVEQIPEGASAAATGQSSSLITGRALIFWDPKTPGPEAEGRKKLDAIDTDRSRRLPIAYPRASRRSTRSGRRARSGI
jgi:hypothetical protein